jgi:hypothetical protein
MRCIQCKEASIIYQLESAFDAYCRGDSNSEGLARMLDEILS